MKKPFILVTGASGYVGGRLVHQLHKQGYRIRCTARRVPYIRDRFPKEVDIVKADAMHLEEMENALEGIDIAFYLIHSLGTSEKEFEELEELCASNFARAAKKHALKRIIYLGGIIAPNRQTPLSSHMRSRKQVGDILRVSGIQVIAFRASIIIGAGSISFELCRSLCERLPLMIVPKWVSIEAQPIAIDDVLMYLQKSISVGVEGSKIYDIGCREKSSYLGLMEAYIRYRKLRRFIIKIPLLSLRTSSFWVGLITPIYSRIGRKLIESLKNPTIVERPDDTGIFQLTPLSLENAIKKAILDEDEAIRNTHWTDALSSTYHHSTIHVPKFGNRIIDTYTMKIAASQEDIFNVIQRIGGKQGWYFANSLWRLRGTLDVLFGGTGLKRQRKHDVLLEVGDIVDWWRVEKIAAPNSLQLRAEMKLPGRAWLHFEIEHLGATCRVYQTALFDPIGIAGLLYWYLLYPIHWIVFQGMLRHIKKIAQTL